MADLQAADPTALARCACCGQPVSFDIEAVIARQRITRHQAKILRLLDRSGPLGAEALAGRIYADDPDGGPDNAANAVWVYVSHLRRKLRREGATITWRRHEGYRLEIGAAR